MVSKISVIDPYSILRLKRSGIVTTWRGSRRTKHKGKGTCKGNTLNDGCSTPFKCCDGGLGILSLRKGQLKTFKVCRNCEKPYIKQFCSFLFIGDTLSLQ